MSDPIVITRELVKRGWSDFEPKLITGLLSGSASAVIISFIANYVHLQAWQEQAIGIACFFVGGYLTPSTGTAVTKRIDSGLREIEQHRGNSVTVVTAATPVQAPMPAPPSSATFTQVLADDTPHSDDRATAIMPSPDNVPTEVAPSVSPQYARSASILDAIKNRQEGQA